MSTFFGNSASVRRWMGIDRAQPEKVVAAEIDRAVEALRAQIPISLPADLLRRMILFRLREGFDSFYSEQRVVVADGLAQLKAAMGEVIRNGHGKVLLNDNLVPKERAAALARMHWRVLWVPAGDLILPDCVALSLCTSSARPYSAYTVSDHDSPPDHILLPLAANRLLVGTLAPGECVRVGDFNRAAAMCSFDFFVSPKAADDVIRIAQLIGTHPKEDVLGAVRETAAMFKPTPTSSSNFAEGEAVDARAVSAPQEDTDGTPAYTISFLGCASQQAAEEISAVVKTLVTYMATDIPLRRLESIAFADDYAAALRNLDRGFAPSAQLQPTEEANCTGVAMAPIVVRNGEILACVVARGWLAHALHQSEDEQAFLTSVHTLGTMLGRVAFIHLFDSALPGTLLRPVEDRLKSFLFQYIDDACSMYFAARSAAMLFPGAAEAFVEVLLRTLESLNIDVPKARLAYRLDGNMDGFMAVLVPAVGRTLVRSAALLGHCDGGDGTSDLPAELSTALELSDLRSWIEVFRRDLRENYDRRGRWQSLDEFTDLSDHMERLMWHVGVIPWRTGEGDIRVEVPIGTDLAALQALQRADCRPAISNPC
jgi:hypothetical protein